MQNQLTPRQKVICDILRRHRESTNKMLLEKCSKKFGDISRITIVRDLRDLVRRRFVMRYGSGRGVTYRAQKRVEVSRRKQHLPLFLKKYFWDTDMAKLSPTKHATYIIERILEWGDMEAVKWLREEYPERTIVAVLDHSRRISDRSWNFWKLIFSHNNFLSPCIRRSSKKTQEKIWKY